MAVQLFESQAAAAGWQLVDFLRLRLRSDPAVGGVAALDFGQLDPGELWLIDRAVISCDSTSRTAFRFYEDVVDPLRILSGSSTGNFDEAEYPGGLQVAPSTSLVAAWVGASNLARGVVSIQGRILRQGV